MIAIELGGNSVSVDAQRGALMTVKDVQGSYTLPYIQTGHELKVVCRVVDSRVAAAKMVLAKPGSPDHEASGIAPEFAATFSGLSWGEYGLVVRGLDANGGEVCRTSFERIAIGTIIAAIGDSITEGYYGRGFHQKELNVRAEMFPPESVSRNGRNFPQFAPTTHAHLPDVNYFESWMTQLNDRLSETWGRPVFIANEGWGGITSGGYLDMMRTDASWRKRMQRLKPDLWLIHLGVNDERAHVEKEAFAANLDAIASLLISEYGAEPARILLAKPCFDYFEGAKEILEIYSTEIDRLIAKRGLGRGAELFAAYAKDRARWYGEDPVHPNVAGMDRMADLWADALIAAYPKGPDR